VPQQLQHCLKLPINIMHLQHKATPGSRSGQASSADLIQCIRRAQVG
jgi:hypothetical protein